MSGAAIDFLSMGTRRGIGRDMGSLVDAAGREQVEVRHEPRWDVYLINGVERPDIRHLLVRLLTDGVLTVADPDAELSLVVPSGGAR